MASFLVVFFFFSLSSLVAQTQSNTNFCLRSFCHDHTRTPAVNFPFHLKNQQDSRCGYNTSFVLSCNTQNQTILKLPKLGGDFIVREIDYRDQILWLSDPNGCFMSRFLNSTYSHDFSPFRALGTKNLTFLNCSSDIVPARELEPFNPYEPVICLRRANYTVLAVEEGHHNDSWSRKCPEIGTFAAPETRPSVFDWEVVNWIGLEWDEPNCRTCVARGGECGFKSGYGGEIGCTVSGRSTGLPRSAKYGIIIGVVIPGFLFLVGIGCFVCGKISYYAQRRRRQHNASGAVFSIPITLQLHEIETGLDGPTIESYPKTKLGKSGRLPKPNDTTCSICLGDYQPEETLRTIPECGHYFHIGCIDEWLKMKGTCPLCRNSPEGSIFTTTPLSSSSSSVLSMSSP